MKKKTLFSLLAISMALAGKPVYAASEACDLSPQYKAFTEASLSNSYSSDDIRKELGARIGLLQATIACAKNDISNLRNRLPEASTDDAQKTKDRIVQALDEASHFYDLRAETTKDLGLQGTKDIAREIKAWRNNNYGELAGRVKNFELWNNNQDLFGKANSRLSSAQVLVASLKLIDKDDGQKLYYDAKADFDNATKLNQRAKDGLGRGIPSDEVLDNIKQSLESLSSVYKKLFDMSNLLNKIIPKESN